LLDKSSIRIDIFLHSLSSMLEDNLAYYLISTTSNMLALYYLADSALRKSEPNAQKYADLCAGRVKAFLKEKVILEDTFDVAVEIFAIAITPNLPVTEDLPSMNKIRDQEKISEVVSMAALGTDFEEQELDLMSDIVDLSLGMPDASDILSLMGSRPDMVRAMLKSKSYKGEVSKASEIAQELSKVAKNASKARSILADFAQLAGLVACSAMAFAGNIMAVHSFEAIAAAVVIPVSVVTLRYGARIGEKLGEKLAEFEKDFKLAQSDIKDILADIIPAINHTAGIIVQSVSKQNTTQVANANIELGDIAKNLSSHIDTISTDREVANIQKSLQEKQKNSREIGRE